MRPMRCERPQHHPQACSQWPANQLERRWASSRQLPRLTRGAARAARCSTQMGWSDAPPVPAAGRRRTSPSRRPSRHGTPSCCPQPRGKSPRQTRLAVCVPRPQRVSASSTMMATLRGYADLRLEAGISLSLHICYSHTLGCRTARAGGAHPRKPRARRRSWLNQVLLGSPWTPLRLPGGSKVPPHSYRHRNAS